MCGKRGQLWFFSWLGGLEALLAWSSPRRATYFSCSTREVGKRSAPHWPWPCGQPAMLGRGAALPNSLCSLRSRRSNSGSESVHEARMLRCARPTPCASRHGQKGVKSIRAIAALGLGLISAAASRGGFCSLSLWERAGVRASQFRQVERFMSTQRIRSFHPAAQADQARAAIKK